MHSKKQQYFIPSLFESWQIMTTCYGIEVPVKLEEKNNQVMSVLWYNRLKDIVLLLNVSVTFACIFY